MPFFRLQAVLSTIVYTLLIFVVLTRSEWPWENEAVHAVIGRALVNTMLLFAIYVITGLCAVRSWNNFWAWFVTGIFTMLVGALVATVIKELMGMFDLPSDARVVAFEIATTVVLLIGTNTSAGSLIKSRLVRTMRPYSVEMLVDASKPFIFGYYSSQVLLSVVATILYVNGMPHVAVCAYLVAIVLMWMLAYDLDQRFKTKPA